MPETVSRGGGAAGAAPFGGAGPAAGAVRAA